MTQRHNVFVSYHHNGDQAYKESFEKWFSKHLGVMNSRSVDLGDISPDLSTEVIRQKIRDEHIRDATVTIVLIGKNTWQRKHVDWEIYSSLRDTKFNPRCGLLGILLPTYSPPRGNARRFQTIPPRLHDNVVCSYAKIYDWNNISKERVNQWIHHAFQRRDQDPPPDLSRPMFRRNRSEKFWQ